MPKSETLHIRIDPEIKTSVDATLKPLGLSTTEAINIFLHQVVLNGGLPFAIRMPEPNMETIAAMKEAQDISSGRIKTKAYHSVKQLMEDLCSDADD
ncbi:type II toxin-antitoxin system RelB/DinJ family antitoxin [Agathobaculum sp. NTUH-O15-33]|uniref:type II toxin-antitoxin system RelB/DinJ family antitoxin n=1 Tax=Agathobaculum sp. NTUH-O15-33 TaxID=3079302 RepID=UPI002958D3D6|nr:type II toxin-antitoxin system RelB/DinJ family antitoxin [Agathobaculum sp. NTUH-O15-33]WNX84747.1 type II toxin-antitoxin system RelB/DinJ family antitoxin [Agathobaculum sp. NTUH-O15-33]